ncbi:unnamed protein product [Gadus morhua 'NCC']
MDGATPPDRDSSSSPPDQDSSFSPTDLDNFVCITKGTRRKHRGRLLTFCGVQLYIPQDARRSATKRKSKTSKADQSLFQSRGDRTLVLISGSVVPSPERTGWSLQATGSRGTPSVLLGSGDTCWDLADHQSPSPPGLLLVSSWSPPGLLEAELSTSTHGGERMGEEGGGCSRCSIKGSEHFTAVQQPPAHRSALGGEPASLMKRSAALCRRLSLQSERRDKSPLGLSELRLQGSAEQQTEEQPITALTLWRRGQGDVDRCTPSAALKVLDPSRLWSQAPLVSGDFPQMFLVCLTACQSSSDLKRSPPPDEFSLSVLSLL